MAQFASNFEAQLDFRDEAANLHAFRDNFGSTFWQSLVSFPRPIRGLVAEHVLVETFEPRGRLKEAMPPLRPTARGAPRPPGSASAVRSPQGGRRLGRPPHAEPRRL